MADDTTGTPAADATDTPTYTQADAEAAGWRFFEAAGEGEIHRAERYVSRFGATSSLVEKFHEDFDKLLEIIGQYELQFGGDTTDGAQPATVTVPDAADPEADPVQITEAERSAAAQNDFLTVLSDPTDPESDPQQVVVRAGVETLAQDDEATQASQPEIVQPAPSEATNASDSEQQSQVPDSEAASSDAGQTNDPTDHLPAIQSAPEVLGPNTDAIAPASAPNATDAAPTGLPINAAPAEDLTAVSEPEQPAPLAPTEQDVANADAEQTHNDAPAASAADAPSSSDTGTSE